MDLLLNWKCGTVCAEVSLRPETLRPVGRRIFCWTRCSGAGSSTPWWTTLIGHFGCWVYRLWLKFGGFELRYIICIQMVSYDDFLKCSQSMGFNFNWSKFGWFVGTPISGNLHMNHRNVLHIHVKIVQHQPSAKDQGNDSEWGTCGCRHLPPLLRSDSPWPSMIQLLGLKSSEAKDSHGGLFFWTMRLAAQDGFNTEIHLSTPSHRADPQVLDQSCLFESFCSTLRTLNPNHNIDSNCIKWSNVLNQIMIIKLYLLYHMMRKDTKRCNCM